MLRGPKFPLRHKRPARVTAAFRPTGSVAAKNYASVLYARLTPETWSRSAEGGIAFVPVQKYEIMLIRDHPTADPDQRMLSSCNRVARPHYWGLATRLQIRPAFKRSSTRVFTPC